MTRDSWLRTAHEFLQVILNDESKNWAFFAEFKAGTMCKKNRSDCRARKGEHSKNRRLGACISAKSIWWNSVHSLRIIKIYMPL